MKITLPYPPPSLSPNARKHWAAKHRAFRYYKADCLYALIGSVPLKKRNDFPTKFALRFCPPDKRRRDIDNAIASFKAGIDAIAEFTRTDDSKFELTFAWGEPVKGGAVIVEAA
jgi:crossover junction endodeoxyribonuclease RusA